MLSVHQVNIRRLNWEKKGNTKAGTLTVSPMHIGNWSFGTTQNMCATLAEESTSTVIMSKHPTNMGDSA
jgi:hypothetical protein